MTRNSHGHRKYTMSPKAIEQRRIARQVIRLRRNACATPPGKTIGLHITPQAADIVLSFPQGKPRREFLSAAILQHSATTAK